MPPSVRFTHPTATDVQPILSTSLVSPSSSTENVPATPLDEVAQCLRFQARVPTPGMHSSNHSSDCIRTHIHLSNPRTIDIEPFEPITFDGSLIPVIVVDVVDIAVRDTDIPPNPDDDDECTSLPNSTSVVVF